MNRRLPKKQSSVSFIQTSSHDYPFPLRGFGCYLSARFTSFGFLRPTVWGHPAVLPAALQGGNTFSPPARQDQPDRRSACRRSAGSYAERGDFASDTVGDAAAGQDFSEANGIAAFSIIAFQYERGDMSARPRRTAPIPFPWRQLAK